MSFSPKGTVIGIASCKVCTEPECKESMCRWRRIGGPPCFPTNKARWCMAFYLTFDRLARRLAGSGRHIINDRRQDDNRSGP